jgi:hypothetical protein
MYYPNQSLKVMIAFADLFNKIKFPIYDADKKQIDERIIPLGIATSQKFILELKSTEQNNYIPRMGFALTAMDPDEENIKTKDFKIMSSDTEEWIFNGIPYIFSIDLSIAAEKTSQLTQIVESIITKYRLARVYPLIEFKFSNGEKIKHDMPVTLTSTSIELQDEISGPDREIYTATLSFSLKANLYNVTDGSTDGTESGNTDDSGIIKLINIDFEDLIQQEYSKYEESYCIYEDTGGTIVID